MTSTPPAGALKYDSRILWFALGYFLFYIPYSALTKALTGGLLPGMGQGVSGLVILPATAIATAAAMPLFTTLMGWWKYAGRRRILGLQVPFPSSRASLASGVGFALIIATTTLAYTFEGISIVFALLLMRGGVLIMAPLIDKLFHREVRWHSWTALALSLLALAIAFSDTASYTLSLAALVNLAAYLTGYSFRLRHMTVAAKQPDIRVNMRYLVEEQMVAMTALIAVPGLLALIGATPAMLQLRLGFTSFLFSHMAWPAFAIGLFYAGLGIFGTLIYLDRRENTFAIPVNRCSSLLSGVAASFGLAALLGQQPPRLSQLAAAGIIIVALLFLSVPLLQRKRLHARLKHESPLLRKAFLFVCSGNTSRSPMAQAICRAEIARRLGIPGNMLDELGLVASAGLTPTPGKPMTRKSATALRALGVRAHRHASRPLTGGLVASASAIFCMTRSQLDDLIDRFPQAAGKAFPLDASKDIGDPSGSGMEAFLKCARQLQELVSRRLNEA